MLKSCDIGITADIPLTCIFHHRGLGVVIGDYTKIRQNCQIYSNVCIGAKGKNSNDGNPEIRDNCVVGTGSIILGNIKIGNNVIIAAGFVIIDSMPDNVMVAGNPAKKTSIN